MARAHHLRPMTPSQPTSRKRFLAGAALGAGALLAGCGEDSGGGTERGSGARDVTVLNDALDREHASVALYQSGLSFTRGRERAALKTLLAQEREHVRGLREAIRDLGGAPRSALALSAYRKRLRFDGVGGAAFLRLATRVEADTIAAYLELLPTLSDGRLRQTAAAIMADEAQHAAILTGLADPGRPVAQAPSAFVGIR